MASAPLRSPGLFAGRTGAHPRARTRPTRTGRRGVASAAAWWACPPDGSRVLPAARVRACSGGRGRAGVAARACVYWRGRAGGRDQPWSELRPVVWMAAAASLGNADGQRRPMPTSGLAAAVGGLRFVLGVRRLSRATRAQVMGLHELGLGVIFDVVYNHTSHSRSSERAVLDRIVPGFGLLSRSRGLPAAVPDG